jgi:ABC-type glycerol-3-phosphate transport system substrate-binding protein
MKKLLLLTVACVMGTAAIGCQPAAKEGTKVEKTVTTPDGETTSTVEKKTETTPDSTTETTTKKVETTGDNPPPAAPPAAPNP